MSLGMNSVGLNQPNSRQIAMRANSEQTVQAQEQVQTQPEYTLTDVFKYEHKKNGLVERAYNGVKNLTGLGTGSKKVKAVIAKAEKGEISEEEAQKTIDKYRKSQANSAQAVTDILSVGAAGLTYYKYRNHLKQAAAGAKINENIVKESKSNFSRTFSEFFSDKKCLELAKNNGKLIGYAALGAMAAGAMVKMISSKINRIGSKEFKLDKKDYNNLRTEADKAQYKLDKKALKKARRKANFKNFIGGAVNGLMMPVSILGGGIAGVPLYLAGNSLNRYFVSNSEEKNKTFNGYVENLKNDGVTHVLTAAAMAVPMFKKASFTKVFDQNLAKAVDRLKDVTLRPSEFKGVSTYQELDNILMNSKSVQEIVDNSDLPIEEKVKKLSEENIFAVKFKQIANDKSDLTQALKEDCPPTRCFLKPDGKWDLTEIQEYVTKNLDGKYEVKQCLGVGTVAETYLATGSDGKDVCLKVLKKGIDEAKIKADKAKFIDIINNLDPAKYNQEQKEYFIKNIDDLANGILKEVDFNHEAEAAKKLIKSTNVANVVKPIEVKNGIYIMEKANGISLQSLVDLNTAHRLKEYIRKNPEVADFVCYLAPKGSKLEKLLKNKKGDEVSQIIDDFIKKVESRTPGLSDGKLTKSDYSFMLDEYAQLLTEQFNKVDKNGKVLHADIHPGNIFIDIQALKNRKTTPVIDTARAHLGYRKPAKIFTLIDTGNVVNQSIEESLDAICLSSYIERGNYKDIAKYVTKGAKSSMSEEKMAEIVEKELKELFTKENSELGIVTSDNILDTSANIMRKHGIIPANTQLNLKKAQTSAFNSLNELFNHTMYLTLEGMDPSSKSDRALAVAKISAEILPFANKVKQMQSKQEKLNLLQMTLEQRNKFKKNPNMPALNSEEYLFYKLKQKKMNPNNQGTDLFG